MLKYIYQSLMFSRKAFSRNFKWLMFCRKKAINDHQLQWVVV